jgi:hypothetical protein
MSANKCSYDESNPLFGGSLVCPLCLFNLPIKVCGKNKLAVFIRDAFEEKNFSCTTYFSAEHIAANFFYELLWASF